MRFAQQIFLKLMFFHQNEICQTYYFITEIFHLLVLVSDLLVSDLFGVLVSDCLIAHLSDDVLLF